MPARKTQKVNRETSSKVPRFSQTQILYTLLLVAVFLVGYLLATVQYFKSGSAPSTAATANTTANGQQAAPKVTLDQVKDAFNKSLLKFGDSKSKVIAVEVADPSCPYCHIAGGHNPELNQQAGSQFLTADQGGSYVPPVPELKKLLDEGKIAFSYIYFPGHGNGEMGAKAMYCANEQGKFWDVHNLLMSSAGYDLLNNTVKNDASKSQEVADFLASAADPATMKACLDSGKYDQRLKDDTALATALNISGTPGFYLNDTVYAGAYSYTDMEKTIKDAGL